MSAGEPPPEATPSEPVATPLPRPTLRATLVRLRIAGFKSFAETTQVEVLPGLTGIVGPNGCGKSNVVEALRWAMGETSARSLRGGEMDDVIFAGTANRPGRNIAEVTLSLEDASGLAPAPFTEADELELARRIERGAGSSFRLNGKEVRARDVQTMFADIGSGARASGMVSQGRVATLIQAKPEERRAVLEEAAGIAGLRARRHEAELKLRQAETNLTRAEDLLGQLETQRQGLQKQARQANRYRSLSGLVRQAEAEWLALLRARASAALAHAMANLQAARSKTRHAEEVAEAAARAAFAAEQALPGPRQEEAQARSMLERRRVEAEGLEAEQRRAEEALSAAQLRAAQLAQDLGHAERLAEDARTAEAALAREDDTLVRTQAALPAQVMAAREVLALAADHARSAELEANVATEEAAALAARANQTAQDLAAAAQRHQRLSQQLADLQAELVEAEAALVPPERLAAASEAVHSAVARLTAMREAQQVAERRRAMAAEAVADARRLLADSEAQDGRSRQAVLVAQQRYERIKVQHDRLAAELREALATKVTPEQLAAVEHRVRQAESAASAARAALEAAEAARAEALQRRSEVQQTLAESEAQRARATEQLAASRHRMDDVEAEYTSRLAELDRARAGAVPAEIIEATDSELKAAELAVTTALEDVQRAEAERAAAATRHEGARAGRAAAQVELSRLQAEMTALTETLALPPESGHSPPLSEALAVPTGLEAAVGAALGEALESPVDVVAARHWRTLPAMAEVQELPPGVTPLHRLLPVPEVLARVASQIGLLDEGVDGAHLQPRLRPGQIIVSRDGAAWRWDGLTATAEAPNPEVVRLQQRNRLRSTEARAVAAAAALAAADDVLADAAASAALAVEEEMAARAQRGRADERLAAARSRHAELNAQAAESSGRMTALQTQIAWLERERAGVAAAVRAAEAALATSADVAELRRSAEEARQRADEAQQAEARCRTARSHAEVSAQEARSEAARLAARAAQIDSRTGVLEPQLGQLAAELQEADRALADAKAALGGLPDLATLRAALDAAARGSNAAQDAEMQGRTAIAAAEAGLVEAREGLAQLEREAARATSRSEAMVPLLERLLADTAEAEAWLAQARSARAETPDLTEIRAGLEQARARLSTIRAEEVAAREALSALQADQARVAARRGAIGVERENWSGRLAAAIARVSELRQRCAEAQASVSGLAELPSEVAGRRAELSHALSTLETAHAAAAARLADAEAAQRASVEARRVADAGFAASREGQLRADAAREQAEAAAAAVEERVTERLGENAELPLPEDLTDASEDRARRKLERLVREREEMGPVNLRADGELAELETRSADIVRERDEITAAIAKLRGTVGHLNREGRERLREVFARVDAEFRSLFSRLFGGGRAHLALVGSDDPLEAGLEIYAEPPGKKLSALSLLSGGEQALTALSLIFAVFRCQPAPVCVLDEVDAPLDDANVERLCDLLDHIAAEGGTRFLIVTHHPLTMARMHRLYGVTMQERGVSRLLSVDLARAVELAEGPRPE